jgi:hypothetical protein
MPQENTTLQDKWGRWTSQTFQGRTGVCITIISAYQVVTDGPGKILTTAASQQQSFLIQDRDLVISPRKAFRRDFKYYIQQCQGKRQEILFVGDFDEQVGGTRLHAKIMDEIRLISTMKHYDGGQLTATYARRQRCLVEMAGMKPLTHGIKLITVHALSTYRQKDCLASIFNPYHKMSHGYCKPTT